MAQKVRIRIDNKTMKKLPTQIKHCILHVYTNAVDEVDNRNNFLSKQALHKYNYDTSIHTIHKMH